MTRLQSEPPRNRSSSPGYSKMLVSCPTRLDRILSPFNSCLTQKKSTFCLQIVFPYFYGSQNENKLFPYTALIY
jgi:hypothetical protein